MRDYFLAVSGGKLDYRNTVVGPVRLSKPQSHYVTTNLVKEALDLAVAQHGVDLTDFDSRGEGVVDAVSFMYAGRIRTSARATSFSAQSSDSIRRAFLRFDVRVPAGSVVTKATLRLYARSAGSTSGIELHGVADDTWGERTLNWDNEPAIDPAFVDSEAG